MLNNIKSYEDAVSFINTIPRFADKKDFEYMQTFYNYMNIEDAGRKVFHIAGTNGKGSTCSYLASIHRAMGKRTGVFTSPHLTDVRERIAIDGEMISKDDFLTAFLFVYEKYHEFIAADYYANYHPTYFAWLFFVAAVYFNMKKVDVIIWETGLGGRLDATNVVNKKDVCIITEIGLDHMEYLGDTLEAIASEKAGIIRSGVPVVIADRENEATVKLLEECKLRGAVCIRVGKCENTIKNHTNDSIDFLFNSSYYYNATFRISTYAKYQVENASLALASMETVYDKTQLSLDVLQEGILNMKWPGRMEIIEPGVVFDGAHNVDGISALLESVKADGCVGKRMLLFSAVADKQADIMLGLIQESGLFERIALAHIDNSRGLEVEKLLSLVKCGDEVSAYEDVTEAYKDMKQYRGPEDMLYVCGSLYLVVELKSQIL